MKKKIYLVQFLCVFVFLFQTQKISAQRNIIDSLLIKVKTEKKDTAKTLIYANLSREYLFSNFDSSYYFIDKGLSLSKKLNFKKGIAWNLVTFSAYLNQIGNQTKALELGIEALKISEEINDPYGKMLSIGNLGVLYGYQNDFDKTIEYTKQSYEIAKKYNFKNSLISNLINLGAAYLNNNNIDSSRFYINLALNEAYKQNDHIFMSAISSILGNIHQRMSQYNIALEYYKQGLSYADKINYREAILQNHIAISKLFDLMNNKDSSVIYARNSLNLAKSYNHNSVLLESSTIIYNFYKQKNQVDSAFKYLEIINQTKDSLFNKEKIKQIQNITLSEKIRQAELNELKLAQEQEKHELIQYSMIAVFILFFSILMALLSNSIIINERVVKFLGIMWLLFFFEFINLLLHPYIIKVTHHSPVFMLLIMVVIASLIIPSHHKLEKWILPKLIERNKKIRLKHAKEIIEKESNF